MPPQLYTITLEEAQKRTRYWRKAIEPLYGKNPYKQPHGFFIHMNDLQELCNLHKYLHQEIEGVRVYFTFDEPQHPDEHGHLPRHIRGIFVPVYLGEAGIEETGAKVPRLMDLIVSVKRPEDGELPQGHVSVYDVSQPCPPICDPDSPLFQDIRSKKEE